MTGIFRLSESLSYALTITTTFQSRFIFAIDKEKDARDDNTWFREPDSCEFDFLPRSKAIRSNIAASFFETCWQSHIPIQPCSPLYCSIVEDPFDLQRYYN